MMKILISFLIAVTFCFVPPSCRTFQVEPPPTRHPAIDPLYPPTQNSGTPDLFFTPTTGSVINGNGPSSFYTRCVAGNKGTGAFINDPTKNFHFVHYKTLNLNTGVCWSGWKDYFNRLYIAPGDSDEYNQNYGANGKGNYIVWAELNAANPRGYKESDYTNNEVYFGMYYTDTLINGFPTWLGVVKMEFVTKETMRQIDHCK